MGFGDAEGAWELPGGHVEAGEAFLRFSGRGQVVAAIE
jgi:8-oxo-dGTP pyrophosphatase MutT (NUDIX family)